MSKHPCATLSCGHAATQVVNADTRPEHVCDDCYEYFYTCPECGVECDTDFMHTPPGADCEQVCKPCFDRLLFDAELAAESEP